MEGSEQSGQSLSFNALSGHENYVAHADEVRRQLAPLQAVLGGGEFFLTEIY